MRRVLPWILVVGGAVLAVSGIVLALLELSALYGGVLESPLDQPDGFEKKSADAMLRYAMIAAPGVVCLLVGKIMLRRGQARRR